MATIKVGEDGVDKPIFCDRIEIPMKLVIDVTDNPDGLKEETAEFLRKLVSEDETERAMAQEDLLMAFIAESPAAYTMSYGTDSAEAIQNLIELNALAAEGHYAEERKRRKARVCPQCGKTGDPLSSDTWLCRRCQDAQGECP